MNRILGASLSDEAWTQAQLPVSLSGLGLRSAEEHASSAFLGSINDTEATVRDLVKLTNVHMDLHAALVHFSKKIFLEDVVGPEVLVGQRQKMLSFQESR